MKLSAQAYRVQLASDEFELPAPGTSPENFVPVPKPKFAVILAASVADALAVAAELGNPIAIVTADKLELHLSSDVHATIK